jgi:carbamoyl-phosphate synthase small subunit
MAKLILEDGREFAGRSLGKSGLAFGELVFNTGMTGYQETISDPSYAGQIITFTYPEIGNYGCNADDMEASEVFTKGVVLKNYSPIVSNFRAEEDLDSFLKRHNVAGIYNIDTRAVTKHIRNRGAMKAVICSDDGISKEKLLNELQRQTSMSGKDLASEVSCNQAYQLNPNGRFKVIALDFGIKQNILNKLIEHDCAVQVVPANTDAKSIIASNPDGIFLSNGPGDPAALSYAIDTVTNLINNFDRPIFGICLGHQILALASAAKTYKLKFGHRGANQPIKNLITGQIEIASHNHGFAVAKESLPENLIITHLNINDDTIAGIQLKNREDVFSVQYHPEASPGPHDSNYLFTRFINLMQGSKQTHQS